MDPAEPIFSATRILHHKHKDDGSPSHAVSTRNSTRRPLLTSWHAAQWCYNWALWAFLVSLVAAQFSCVFWNSSSRHDVTTAGREPVFGPHDLQTDAVDPEPYVDRLVVCVLNGGRQYQPMLLSRALGRAAYTRVEDSASINAYRVVPRTRDRDDPSITRSQFSTTCNLIAWTLDAIMDSCTALGYNVTRDYVRVVSGLDSAAEIVGIPDSLPLLIEPVGDGATVSRYIIPSYDGTACMVRLLGKYETSTSTSSLILRGVNRTVYEQKTLSFLELESSAGTWRNGWFEASSGVKWHSEVISTGSGRASDAYGVLSRVFDTERNTELSVTKPTAWAIERPWGSIATASDTLLWIQSVTISNGAQFGIYRYEAALTHVLRTTYTLENLLTNLSIMWILLRWAACMVATHRAYKLGHTVVWQGASIGNSVSCMRGFHLLPLVLLVRLKNIFAAFWTVGMPFSGDQRAVSEAWFIIYPAIVELVFFHFSMQNIIAKLFRRRISDVLFGPMVVFFCLLHLARCFVFPEPVTACVSSDEIKSMSLPQILEPNVVMRLHGDVEWLVAVKIAVLVSTCAPLLVYSRSNASIRKQSPSNQPRKIERALALRVSNLGGFGPLSVTESTEPATSQDGSNELLTRAIQPLAPLELVRMGYVVIGGRVLVSFNDFFLLLVLIPWRQRHYPPNFRIAAFTVEKPSHSVVEISGQPELMRLNDPRLLSLDLFDISTLAVY